MADNSPVEEPTQEIENKNGPEEPEEPNSVQTEEIPVKKVVGQVFII